MRKGFSLIELTVAISILTIFSLAFFLNISNYKKYSSEMDMLMSENMIIALINNGKQYCREKERSGYVLFDVVRNEVSFYSSTKRVDGIKLPKSVNIFSINTKFNKVDINKFGTAIDAGTIILKDKEGKLYPITISVGTGYAEIK